PDCIIFDLLGVVGNCTSDSAYILDISFGNENLPVDSVVIYVNGALLGQFKLPNDFLHILNFPQVDSDITTIIVYAVGDSTCFDTFTFPTPDCTPGECEFSNLVAVAQECNSDTTYRLVIEYNSEFIPGDSVTLSANGQSFGLFVDPDQHIIIENFPVFDSATTTILLCSFEIPDCCADFTFETPDCEPPCSIFDLIVDTGSCTSDSTYSVLVAFDFDGIQTDSVIITANGELIGQFSVSNGFILIQNFPEFDADQTIVQVCAVGAPDCCDVFEFETVQCGIPTDCNISNLTAEVGDCTSDSTYVLILDFGIAFLPTDSVLVTSNDGFSEVYQVSEGHIVIDQFPVFSGDITEIQVCALGDVECCDDVSFETPDSAGLCDCDLFDLFAEIGDCTSDSTFILDIELEENNFPGDSVVVSVGNSVIGHFFNAPDVIRIQEFPFFPGDLTTITVCALEAPDCCDTYTFNSHPSCGGCDIFDLEVAVNDCTSDSTFGVVINFQWENVDSTGFDIYYGDGFLGFFTFDQIPVVISTFPSNSSGEYVISVCANDNSQCCETLEFEGPLCPPVCDINDLTWSITECDSADQFYFLLDFNFQDVGTQGFSVVGNGNNYGTFSYDNLPVQIGPFEEGTNIVFEFLVSDNEFAGCIDFIEPGVVECLVATEDIRAEDLFEIYNNGTIPQIFAKKDLSITLANSNGKILYAAKSMAAESYVEINNLPSGIYIATIVYNGTRIPVKIVKGSY
ncbi:MAG: T9SS type A sorting domain-containing protein, partial [Saprospiraceae bacterium]